MLLAQTRAQIFSLKTTSMDEYIDLNNSIGAQQQHSSSSKPTVLLEPLQMWQLPSEILSMTTFTRSHYSMALALTNDGQLYSWNPTDGVVEFSSSGTVFPGTLWPSRNELATMHCLPTIAYSSSHPMVSYASIGSNLLGIDLRLSTKASILLSTLDCSVSFSSLCQSDTNGKNMWACSSDGNVSLIDLRYPKQFIARHSFDGTVHKSLKALSLMHDDDALLLGRTSDEIFLHTVNVSSRSEGALPASAISHYTAMFEPCSESVCSWNTTLVPFADSSTAHADLHGAELLPVPATDCDEEDAEKAGHFLLVHQSSIGDVFAQRVAIQDRRKSSLQLSSFSSKSDAQLNTSSQQPKEKIRARDRKRLKKGGVVESSTYASDQRSDILPEPSSAFMATAAQSGGNPLVT